MIPLALLASSFRSDRRSVFLVRVISVLVLGLVFGQVAWAQQSEDWRRMNAPTEPFRIAANLYYVGAKDVGIYLITTPEGHILIDGGFIETVPMIKANMEALGFQFEDVGLVLNSHAHIDHAGGLARLKEKTGAKLFASDGEAALLEAGGRGDLVFGDALAFDPVKVDRRLADREVIEFGGQRLTAHVTAGHTPGCTSWEFEVQTDEGPLRAVSICSLTAFEAMNFVQDPTYPELKRNFERSFARLRSIPCDLFLASHASFGRLMDKARTAAAQGESGPETSNPFVDPKGYESYIDRAEAKFLRLVEEERQGLAAAAPLKNGDSEKP